MPNKTLGFWDYVIDDLEEVKKLRVFSPSSAIFAGGVPDALPDDPEADPATKASESGSSSGGAASPRSRWLEAASERKTVPPEEAGDAVVAGDGDDDGGGRAQQHRGEIHLVCGDHGYSRNGREYNTFLGAALRLQRPPQKCAVFDLSPQAAIDAHVVDMRMVAVVQKSPFSYFQMNGADQVVRSLNELYMRDLRRLFADRQYPWEAPALQTEPEPKKKKLKIATKVRVGVGEGDAGGTNHVEDADWTTTDFYRKFAGSE